MNLQQFFEHGIDDKHYLHQENSIVLQIWPKYLYLQLIIFCLHILSWISIVSSKDLFPVDKIGFIYDLRSWPRKVPCLISPFCSDEVTSPFFLHYVSNLSPPHIPHVWVYPHSSNHVKTKWCRYGERVLFIWHHYIQKFVWNQVQNCHHIRSQVFMNK